tara:strand:+ start:919 stop:1056 length:138 start_codon:yes stop_codon:yes gene_type:complete
VFTEDFYKGLAYEMVKESLHRVKKYESSQIRFHMMGYLSNYNYKG